jgi:hypothetical protein
MKTNTRPTGYRRVFPLGADTYTYYFCNDCIVDNEVDEAVTPFWAVGDQEFLETCHSCDRFIRYAGELPPADPSTEVIETINEVFNDAVNKAAGLYINTVDRLNQERDRLIEVELAKQSRKAN